MTQVPCELVSGGSKVAGTHAIAAPGASYAVDFSQLMKNAELLPPAAAGCTAGKIDEHREDESHQTKTTTCPRKRGSSNTRIPFMSV